MSWEIEAKEAWVRNIPKVIAYLIQEEAKLNPSTPEGIYNLKLALTDNPEIARQSAIEAARQLMEARLSNATIPDTV